MISEVFNMDCMEGMKLDKDYFDASVKRFNQYKSQLKIFQH